MEYSFRLLLFPHYFRYLLASAVSMSADLLVFISALRLGIPAVSSAVAGYMFGLGVHWILSSRFVFVGAVRVNRNERARQKLLFVASALAGLAVTTGIIGCTVPWGLDPRIAKMIAICISFQTTYLIRSKVVFS